jgi:hypothetical protein
VSKEEALEYLKLREVDKEQAAQIYELVGGRMVHLKYMADKIKRNGTLKGMCTACYTENSFSPPLQLCARRCSPISEVNSSPLEFFLNVVTIRTEPRSYVNF